MILSVEIERISGNDDPNHPISTAAQQLLDCVGWEDKELKEKR